MPKIAAIAGVALLLAACTEGPNGPGVYASPSAAASAQEDCGSGQQADLLHQNRRGGSDYSFTRCHLQGD
jgi:hypothetical protein